MPRRKTGMTDLRDEWYQFKVLRLYLGAGVPADELKELAVRMTEKQHARWRANFGKYTRAWWEKVKGILEKHGVPPLEYAKYRAFMNAYISKVVDKGTRDPEGVIRDFVVKHGCREEVLRDIVSAIGEIVA